MKKLSRIFVLLVLVLAFVALIYTLSRNTQNKGKASFSGVIINEVMSKNNGYCPDEFDNYFDYIELYNSSSKTVDISGCGLSDNVAGKVDFVFKKGTTIDAGAYLIIWCAGDSSYGAGNYAEFKLKSTDNVVLYDVGGNAIEYITLKNVTEGTSYSRQSADNDDWHEMSPTPGYPNTDEGVSAYADFMTSRVVEQGTKKEQGSIIISELMASNTTTIACKDGLYYDWVELYNKTDKKINLKGYSVSDDPSDPTKYVITDNVDIEAQAYLLIFCSGKAGVIEGEVHAPFGLRAYEESFLIADADGNVSDSVEFKRQKADLSIAKNENSEFIQTDKPTPGYPNTAAGYEQFSQTANIPTSAVYFTEIMGSNNAVAVQAGSQTLYPDFIELYNSGGEAVNLSGYALSNSPTNPAKWVFPDITIKSGEYLLVLATSAKEDTMLGGYCQTNFSISSTGDTVYLFSPEGAFLDKLRADSFVKNMSVGKNSDYELLYYGTPSPGAKNATSGYLGLTSTPKFTVTPGIYSEKIKVEIECGEGESVYYTLDCTTPTTASSSYSGAIEIDKNTVVRAATFRDGYFNKYSCISGTYLFTSDECNHSLPVLTLVTDPDNLWSDENGIYAYGSHVNFDDDTWPYWESNANFWKDIEVPASFELFNDDGKQVFQQNIGINIAGAFGQGREQKGMAITARDEYGSNRMQYKFFDDLEYTEYKSLLLRCGAQDQANGKIRDALAAGLLKGTDVNFLYQDYDPYILYLNGEYWGVYFLREKRNRFFVAQHEGLGLDNSDNITLIKSETRSNYGTTAEWAALMNYVRTHDLTNGESYDYLADRMDIDSFIDYMSCEIYVGNSDYWNIQMYKTQNGKWKFIYYDFCWGFNNYDHNTLPLRRLSSQPCSDLFNKLLARQDFRDKFTRRMAELMNSVFEKEKVLALVDELYNQVEPEIRRERSLFNSSSSEYIRYFKHIDTANLSSYDSFIAHINKIKTFANERRSEIISQFKTEFNLSAEYVSEVFGNG